MPPPPRDLTVTELDERAAIDEPAPRSSAGPTDSAAEPSQTRTRIRVARRPALLVTLALVPALAFVAADLARRHAFLAHLETDERHFYGKTLLLVVTLATGLFVSASNDRGAPFVRWLSRLLLAAAALFTVGAQAYTFARYHAYLNPRAILVGTSMLPSIGQQLWSDRFAFAHALLPPLALAIAWPYILRKVAPASETFARASFDVAILALAGALILDPNGGGEQGAAPEFLYLSSMGQLGRAHWGHNEYALKRFPEARTPETLPALVAHVPIGSKSRNVLLILDESVREMSVCNHFSDDCKFTPATNRVTSNRIALDQVRAVDSTTAISLGVVFSGIAPTSSRQDLHSVPLLWEYAHAAGFATDYWTSQNLLFGNSGTWLEGLPLDHRVSATDLDPEAPLETGASDGDLVARVLADLAESKDDARPRLSVVHLSNTHFPYAADESFAPFQPDDEDKTDDADGALRNLYQNAIFLQDRAIGHLIEELRKTPAGASTVIVFTSDHGEQLREKGAVGHTGTLFDQEMRVPFWIDAPPGTLSTEETQHLKDRAQTPTTLLDLLPTLLDLAGVWSDPSLQPYRARMPGESLLRGGSPEATEVITNCTELWSCAFKNWGAMRGSRKLFATGTDHAWLCFDVATDPDEVHDLGVEGCGDLAAAAESGMGGRPF